ncbi:csbC [Symbiodinium pilosum]|uniref:CsbC protein n=1 Tax=Symbiodinium pilosum TaxID=2952 RepID=A0A812PNK8_SYMPI|nr:csbC [Symbiodinium pilosum]
MSDGFVTVGQCIEGLPIGVFVWELLLCAFLASFWLGALNEPTPFALGLLDTDWTYNELNVQAVLAAMGVGNAISMLLAGWFADKTGRANVIRCLTLATVSCGLLVQSSRTLGQTLCGRFLLGLTSGGLLAALIPLVAELLPARRRGFYMTVWCCGRPAGALLAVLISCLLPRLDWTNFVFMMTAPAVVLYILCRLDVMPESPRFLYLAGRREEGFLTLAEMYDKEMMCLPWGPDSVSLTTSSEVKEVKSGLRSLAHSDAAITAWLCLIIFFSHCASQCMRAWIPTILAAGSPHQTPVMLLAMSLLQAAGSKAQSSGASLLSAGSTGLDRHLVMVAAQGYMLEICGVVLCAAASWALTRRLLVRGSLCAAALLAIGATLAERRNLWLTAGPLFGLALIANAAATNFLLVFACERFPTSSRASAVGLVLFFGQVAELFAPAMGVIMLNRFSVQSAVLAFNSLYFVAFLLSFQLPLPGHRERTLHDVEEKGARDPLTRNRKRLGMSYQTV